MKKSFVLTAAVVAFAQVNAWAQTPATPPATVANPPARVVPALEVAQAAPAPWYYWRSKVDGHRLCAQVSPGPGWERDGGPYEGPLCQPRRRVLIVPMR